MDGSDHIGVQRAPTYEIERKFLLDDLPTRLTNADSTRISQGYLAVGDDIEVRIRARAGQHLLTVKGGRGQVRREVTISLTPEQFDDLWSLTEGRRLTKRRWVISDDPEALVDIEIDRFDGALDGLLIAEVEFPSEGASRAFRPPSWFGREVTDDDRYRNAALATGPPH